MTKAPDPPDRHSDAAEPTDNPRAFSQATGLVFQSVGTVLMLGGCCLFSLTGLIQDKAPQPIGSFADWRAIATTAQQVGALDLLLSMACGGAFLAVGIALQSDRPGAGRGGLLVAGFFAAGWWLSLFAYVAAGRWWHIGIALVFAAAGTVLFLLAGNAARTLRLAPPPADANVATPDLEPPSADEKVDQTLDELDRHNR